MPGEDSFLKLLQCEELIGLETFLCHCFVQNRWGLFEKSVDLLVSKFSNDLDCFVDSHVEVGLFIFRVEAVSLFVGGK